MIRVETSCSFSDQTGCVWILSQKIYYNEVLICDVGKRNSHITKELSRVELLRFDSSRVDEFLSEALRKKLLQDEQVKALVDS